MHNNFYSFSAKTHYELGLLMGKKFSAQASLAINASKTDKDWVSKRHTANQMFSISQEYFPQYVEELRGYATGAQVNFADFWTLSLEDDAYIEKNRNSAKCSTLITNGGLLIGHSEDYSEPGFEDAVCIVKKTIAGFSTLEIFYYNTLGGSSIGINSNGFVHAINTLLYTSKKIGVPKSMIARLLLDTKDPKHDLQLVQNLNSASGFSHLICSNSGQVWNAEFTYKTAVVSRPITPYCHTNHCLIGKSGRSKRDSYGTDSRLRFAQSHVEENMTNKQLQILLSDASLGNHKSIYNERTIGRMIVNQESKECLIWLLRESEKGWVTYKILYE